MTSHGISYENLELVAKQKELYNIIIQSIIEPPAEKKVFGKVDNNKLGLVIVEPRKHEWLKGVLYNMCHVYGGSNTPLYIVHGTDNEEFVKDICKDWTNVNYLKLPIDDLEDDQYSELLTNSNFWTFFKTQYVLIFQTDTFIRKQIPEVFFFFDYVGSPWNWTPKNSERMVGNGGFSLRKVQAMIDICNCANYAKFNDEAEDVFFVKRIKKDFIPPPGLASCFSVEHVYFSDPIGTHQTWRFQTFDDIFKWMSNVGGVPTLSYTP